MSVVIFFCGRSINPSPTRNNCICPGSLKHFCTLWTLLPHHFHALHAGWTDGRTVEPRTAGLRMRRGGVRRESPSDDEHPRVSSPCTRVNSSSNLVCAHYRVCVMSCSTCCLPLMARTHSVSKGASERARGRPHQGEMINWPPSHRGT